MTSELAWENDRVLLLAPADPDVDAVLKQMGVTMQICVTIQDCCAAIAENANLAILPAQALTKDAIACLINTLAAQPNWSDFPLIILANSNTVEVAWALVQEAEALGNIRILQQPVHPSALASVVRAVLRARRRQFDLRGYLFEREHYQKALLESAQRERESLDAMAVAKDRLELVLASIDDAFIVLDDQWRCTYINDIAAAALDKNKQDLLGKNLWQSIPEAIGSRFYNELHRALAEQCLVQFENFYPHWDCWFENRVYPSANGLAIFATDITDRKRIEQDLRDSEQRFRLAVDNFPGIFLIYDADRRIRYINTRGIQVVGGLKEHEIIGKLDEDLFPQHMIKTYLPTLVRAIETGQPQSLDHSITLPTGTYWVLANCIPVLDANGSVSQVFTITYDITDRKRSEEERARLAAIVETSYDSIVGLTCEGVITSWNSGAERIFGYSPSEVIGRPIFMMIPPEKVQETVVMIESIRTGKPVKEIETVRIAKGGRRIDIALTVSPIKDLEGNVAYFSAIGRDISERKRTEAEFARLNRNLARRLAELQTLLDVAPIGIAIAHGSRAQWIEVNPAGAALLGVAPGTNISKSGPLASELPFKLIREGRELTADELPVQYAIAHKHAVAEMELQVQREDGRLLTLLEYASPLFDESGEVRGCLGVFVDISAMKAAEEALNRKREALALEYSRLHTVLDVLPMGVFIADRDGKIVQSNAAARDIWGESSNLKGIEEYSQYKAWWPDGRPFSARDWGLANTLKSGMRCEQEVEIENSFGQRKTLLNFTAPILDKDSNILGGVAVNVDISDRKRYERELARLAAIVATSNDAIISKTPEGIITSWNAGAEKMLGYSAAEILGKDTSLVIPPNILPESYQLLERIKNGEGLIQRDITLQGKDGTRVEVSLSLSPIHDSYGNVIAISSIARDITERKHFEGQLQYNAFHDGLTGLANRALFLDRLEHAMSRAQRHEGQYAVLMMDLDNFKVINDSLGHPAGDELLLKFADRVHECLRPVDTLARFGGDEFTVLLEDVENCESVLHVVERIRTALENQFKLIDTEIFSSVSIGIVLGNAEYKDPDAVMRDADNALYEAKHRGKNRYVMFNALMRTEAMSRLRMETELRKAVANNTLSLQYQPIVELATGRVTGCEALLRWHHSDYGQVLPDQFIALADETGLIVQLGEYVIDRVCNDLANWFSNGTVHDKFYISVNLSPKQFYHEHLIEFIDSAILRFGLQGYNLRLEITESVIIKNDRFAAKVLVELRKRGIQICMDDFGTGYSSLSYLHRFPIDILKVDQSFVQTMVKEPASREVVRAIMALADNLNLEAIAEGAEEQEQVEALKLLGCRWVQGFSFYRPLDSDKMLTLLNSNRDHLH